MKIEFIDQPKLKQNSICTGYNKKNKPIWELIPDDFYYPIDGFVGLKIKIEYSKENIFEVFAKKGSFNIFDNVSKLIHNKYKERRKRSCAMNIKFDIISHLLSTERLEIIVKITECKADIG